MAKQTFTTGQVLTAAQMTSLQQTAMLGGAASAKTASYTLVAADAGTAISMSNVSATTITVNTALFAAGDTVHITNLGAGVCTITAGTATVNTSASLALAQYESGFLDFTSTSAAIFVKGAGSSASSSAVVQVKQATYDTSTSTNSTSYVASGLSLAITPTSATNKILVFVNLSAKTTRGGGDCAFFMRLRRDSTAILDDAKYVTAVTASGATTTLLAQPATRVFLDSPATTSSTTYDIQIKSDGGGAATITAQDQSNVSTITLMEVTP